MSSNAWLEFALGQSSEDEGPPDQDRPPDHDRPPDQDRPPDHGPPDQDRPNLQWSIVLYEPLDPRRLWNPTVGESASVEAPPRPYARAPLRRPFDAVLAMCPEGRQRHDDQEIAKIARKYLNPAERPSITSQSAAAESLDIDRRSVHEKMCILASSLVHCDRCALQIINESIRNDAMEMLLFVEFSRYDATDMNVSVKQSQQDTTRHVGDMIVDDDCEKLAAFDREETAVCTRPHSSIDEIAGKTTSRTHLFGPEHGWACLVKVGEGQNSRLVNMFGPSLTWVQAIDRGTAACCKRAVIETAATFTDAAHYKTKMRLATTDAASSNYKTERGVEADRGDEWMMLHMPCNVHKVATGHSKTYSLVDYDITAAIHVSLSVSSAAAMSKFRRAFITVARKRLRVERGRPSALDEEYQTIMLNLFLSRGSFSYERAQMAKSVLNGPWHDHSKLTVYIDGEGPVDAKLRRSVEKNVVRCLNFVCLGRSFRTYPRHRWTGADLSIDEICLCACIHGLLFPAYTLFLTSFGSDDAAGGRRAGGGAARQRQSRGGRAGSAAEAAAPGGADSAAAEPADNGGTRAWQEENEKHRSVAKKWIETEPLHVLIAIRIVMEPWRELMSAYLHSSGDEWEHEQRCIEAAHQIDPESCGRRRFRMSQYADILLDNQFFDDLEKAWLSRTWDFTQVERRTVRFRALCFRMLSRSGCLVSSYLVRPADQFPVALFALIENAAAGPELRSRPPCTRDAFSHHIFESYPGDELGGDECLAKLMTVAQIAHVENVKGETDHSCFKRHVDTQSVHSRRASFEYVNAQIVCQRFRTRLASGSSAFVQGHRARRDRRAGAPATRGAAKTKVVKAKRGGGGTWRSFVRSETLGVRGKPDIRVISVKYHNRDKHGQPEAKLRATGQRASRAHRAGGAAFGPTTRQVRRSIFRRALKVAVDRACANDAPTPLALALPGNVAAPPLTSQEGFNQHRSAVRVAARTFRSSRRLKPDAAASKFDEWDSQYSQGKLQSLVESCPSLIPCKPALQPLPSSGMDSFEVMFNLAEKAGAIAEFAAGNRRSSNMGSVLLRDWAHKNRIIQHDDQPEWREPERQDKCGECFKHGFCVCSDEGKETMKLRNKVLQYIKRVCPRKSKNMDLLKDAFLVLRLEGVKPEQSAWLDVTSEDEAAAAEEYRFGNGVYWLHLGLVLFNPYRPAYHLLKEVPRDESDPWVWLQTTNTFVYDWCLFSNMDRSCSWTGRIFGLVDTSDNIGLFDPTLVPVEALPDAEQQIWPPPPRKRRKKTDPSSNGKLGASAGPSADAVEDGEIGSENGSEAAEGSGHEDGEEESDGSVSDYPEEEEVDMWALVKNHLDGLEKSRGDGDGLAGGQDAAAGGKGPGGPDGGCGGDDEGGDRRGGDDDEPPEDVSDVSGDEDNQSSSSSSSSSDSSSSPRRAGGAKGAAIDAFDIPGGGRIVYYRNGDFVAECPNKAHGKKCRLTRTSRPNPNKEAQGRPLGLMKGWLSMAYSGAFPNARQHVNNKMCFPRYPQRVQHRKDLVALPGSDCILKHERPRGKLEPKGLP